MILLNEKGLILDVPTAVRTINDISCKTDYVLLCSESAHLTVLTNTTIFYEPK